MEVEGGLIGLQAGTVTSAGAWEPYGRPRAAGPNNPNAPPLGWLGQYQDPTGLTHLRARQYDPAAGMFLAPDPAASTSISGTYTYGTANPLRYIDTTGLFSWDEALIGIQDISGIVSDVAGVLAIVALATGVGAPVAAVLGGISIAAGAVHAGTKAIQAYNTCNTGKGSCGDAVAEAILSAVTIPTGAKVIKGAATAAKATAGAAGEAVSAGKYLLNTWHKGTFPNRTQSVRYHLDKHGNGRSPVDYTKSAMAYFAENRAKGLPLTLKDGTPGIKLSSKETLPDGSIKKVGGYWTSDGRLVTYWD